MKLEIFVDTITKMVLYSVTMAKYEANVVLTFSVFMSSGLLNIARKRTHKRTHACMHTYIHTHTHTFTHIHPDTHPMSYLVELCAFLFILCSVGGKN